MLSFKDVLAINEELDAGRLVNKSSLEYATGITRKNKNWLRAAALLTRAILIDHVFEDGNKRTAAAVIMTYFYMNHVACDTTKVNRAVIAILQKNITNIRTIERLIKNAIA